MKRTSLKVLLSAMIILSMIPFSFLNLKQEVKADLDTSRWFRIVSTVPVGTGYGIQIDYIFQARTNLMDGTLTAEVNPVYKILTDRWNYAIIENDGYVNMSYTRSTSSNPSGTAVHYIWTFNIINCSYLHFMVQHMDPDFWTTAKIASYWTYIGDRTATTSTSLTNSNNYYPVDGTSTMLYDDSYYLKQILLTLQQAGNTIIDISGIEGRLDDILLNQTQEISLLQQIAQGSQSSTDASDSLDDAVTDTSSNITDFNDLESVFNSNFESSQEDIIDILDTTDLTAFSNAMNWYIDQLNAMYIAMGDMKILVVLPLILGIALFIIGRGAVIFRDKKQ